MGLLVSDVRIVRANFCCFIGNCFLRSAVWNALRSAPMSFNCHFLTIFTPRSENCEKSGGLVGKIERAAMRLGVEKEDTSSDGTGRLDWLRVNLLRSRQTDRAVNGNREGKVWAAAAVQRAAGLRICIADDPESCHTTRAMTGRQAPQCFSKRRSYSPTKRSK